MLRPVQWITAKGHRLTLLIAALFGLYHVASELRVLAGGPRNFLQRMELTALDVKQSYRPEQPPERWGVAVAAIDEAAIEAYGPLPWSRSVHAALVDRLTEMGAAAIVFDMSFERPQRSARGQLRAAMELAAKEAGLPKAGHYQGHAAALSEAAARVAKARRPAWLSGLRSQLEEAAEELKRVDARMSAFERALGQADPGQAADRAFAAAIQRSGRVVLGVVELSQASAAAIGYDAARLERSLAALGPSLITEVVEESADGWAQVEDGRALFSEGLFRRYFGLKAPMAALAEATPHFGAINASPDEDGINRRIPLVSALRGAGVLVPSLALKGVAVGLGEKIEALASPSDLSLQGIRVGQWQIPTELSGTATLHWYGQLKDIPSRSVAALLSPGAGAEDWAKGRVVFVAATAIGTHDQRVTPLERAVPGVYIHATLAQNLLDGRTLSRPAYAVALELGFILLIGLIGGWMTRFRHLVLFTTAILVAAGWLLFDQLVLFPRGIIVYAVLPVVQVFVTLLAASMWSYLREERERRQTRAAFGRYLSPRVLDKVLSHPEEYLQLGGRRYEATVLFSDIRGFTTISEALSPEALGRLLNEYMTPMTDIVFAHEGTLDKYIGDAVMAFWGAPVEQPDHAELAARAALQMQLRLKEINQELLQEGLPELAIGVGLSSGPMTIGNMGSEDHFAYTALGDRVNLGARLEGQTKTFGVGILIAEDTRAQLSDALLCRELGSLRVKGKKEPVRIFELVGGRARQADKIPFIEAFEAALSRFRARDFSQAAQGFAKAQAFAPGGEDKSCALYLGWCESYQRTPPPADWDGVYTATSK